MNNLLSEWKRLKNLEGKEISITFQSMEDDYACAIDYPDIVQLILKNCIRQIRDEHDSLYNQFTEL